MTKSILGAYSVLYAEDHVDTQEIVLGYLQRYFKEVHVASDGKEALELYHKHRPHVMMLDIDLPHMSGLAVAEEVREMDTQIPIVMLTAYSDTPKMLRAVKLNLTEYLIKPIEPKAFRETLDALSHRLQASATEVVTIGDDYKYEVETMQLYKHQERIVLTHKESLLLALLVEHHRATVSYEDIMARLWQDDFDAEVSIDSVRQQVKQLRKKLPSGVIDTVYGEGFKLI